jgi:hypothetical protein
MKLEKILEAASKANVESGTQGYKKIDIEGFEKMFNILGGKEKFEGSIDSPQQMQVVLDSIKKFYEESKSNPKMGSEEAGAMKKKLAKLYPKINTIQKILDKIKKIGKVTGKDSDVYDDFADEVEDILFYETYYKKFTATETGSSGGKVNKIVYEHSFPIKYTADDGKEYYGLIRPPTGVITWQGDRAREVVMNDPSLKIPTKLPILQGQWQLMKSKFIDKLLASKRVEVKDDSKSKEKVKKAMEKVGASINDRGDIIGMQKALDNVGFWKDITKIF